MKDLDHTIRKASFLVNITRKKKFSPRAHVGLVHKINDLDRKYKVASKVPCGKTNNTHDCH